MTARRFKPALSLSPSWLPMALLPLALLASCGAPVEQPPLGETAMKAVMERPGAPRDLLARAVDNLFTDPAVGETRALLILHNGRIVAERYACLLYTSRCV